MELNSDPSVGLSFYPNQNQNQQSQKQQHLMNARANSRKITTTDSLQNDQQASPPTKLQNSKVAAKNNSKASGRNERPKTAKVRPSDQTSSLQNTTYKAYQVKQQSKNKQGVAFKNSKAKKPLKDLASVSSAAKL